MNFDQLRIFMAVVEHRSFTKAAESLYISHSTTSRNVAALEEALGVQLLRRDNRTACLTPAGEILFREGGKLLKKTEAVETAVRDAATGRVGKLTVASAEPRCRAFSQLLNQFCRCYPEVALGVYHRGTGELWEQVDSGEADIGLGFSFALPAERGHMRLVPLERGSFCVAVSREARQAPSVLRLDELRGQDLLEVDAEGGLCPAAVTERLRRPGAQNRVVRVPTLASLMLQVESGNGAAILPRPVAEVYEETCVPVELEGLDAAFDLVAFWRMDNQNPAVERLAGLLQA